jgi:hypothetical protein
MSEMATIQTSGGGRNMDERGARTGEGDSGLTPLVTMFSGARVSYDIPPRIPLCQSEMTDRKSN